MLLKGVLEEEWLLPMLCNCANNLGNCTETSLSHVVCCMGFCIAVWGIGLGVDHIQPSPLKED